MTPDDAVILHVGVHKTGTTALQAALADARPALRAAGVLYPGTAAAQHREAMSSLGYAWGWVGRDSTTASPKAFTDLASQVRDWPGRVVLSSEFWCEANAEQASSVVEALGRQRVQVVITVRNLGEVLPSSWQQYLKYGMTTSYDEWLTDVLAPDSRRLTPSFWARQDHPAVLQRWVAAVGTDRVTVVVLDPTDRLVAFRQIAQMAGIPTDVLTSRAALTSNRSMTLAEAELLRAVNARVVDRLTWDEYRRRVREGLARTMVESRRPGPDEPAVRTPDWALDEAARRGGAAGEAIARLGVPVVGDLAEMGRRVPTVPEASGVPLPVEAALAAIDGALVSEPRVGLRGQVARAVRSGVRRTTRGGRR